MESKRKNPYFGLGRLISHEEEESAVVNVLLIFFVVLLVAMLSFVMLFSRGVVVGPSMMNTLNDKDNLLITRYRSSFDSGDIVVLKPPNTNPDFYIVKRIVATGGEKFMFKKVLVQNGFVEIVRLVKFDSFGNEIVLDESYTFEDMNPNLCWHNGKYFLFNTEYTVPNGEYLYLGDNRNNSNDSRYYGYAKGEDIVGKCVYIVEEDSILMFLLNLFFPEKEKSTT